MLGLWSCAFLLLAIPAQAILPDALGLKWGLELSDFRQMDFDIQEEWPIWNRATAIRLGTHSQEFTNAGSVILVFDQEFGLIKTHWASKLIERDEDGTKGMKSFERLKQALSQQYGPPDTIHEELSLKLQGFHGSFYQCLEEETCGKWQSIWETSEGGLLILELVGLNQGVGFIQITHQGPHLNNALQLPHPELDAHKQEI